MAQTIELLVLTVMTVLLPLAPVACAVIARQGQYLRDYLGTIKRAARTIRALRQARVIARNLQLVLTRPALTHHIEGSCTHCGRCCLDSACVFLTWTAGGSSSCSIHNNWFWKLTSCGSYPVNAQSIAVYDCPSFKAIPVRLITRQAAPGNRLCGPPSGVANDARRDRASL